MWLEFEPRCQNVVRISTTVPKTRIGNGPFGASSPGVEQSTQNWYGQGESDCLIKTKHCDGPCGC
ncbi:hypothetical protein CR513_36927, partial [Mucuna pruriens]